MMIVKTLASLLAVLLLSIQFAGSDDAKDNPTPAGANPPRTFASVDEMKRWGESSAHGGGAVAASVGRCFAFVV